MTWVGRSSLDVVGPVAKLRRVFVEKQSELLPAASQQKTLKEAKSSRLVSERIQTAFTRLNWYKRLLYEIVITAECDGIVQSQKDDPTLVTSLHNSSSIEKTWTRSGNDVGTNHRRPTRCHPISSEMYTPVTCVTTVWRHWKISIKTTNEKF